MDFSSRSALEDGSELRQECIGEVRGRTGKLKREVVGRLDKGSMRKDKTAQDRCLCPWSVKRPEV